MYNDTANKTEEPKNGSNDAQPTMSPNDMHQLLLWVQVVIGLSIVIANVLTLLSLTKTRQLQISLRVLLGNMTIADSVVGCVFIFNCIVFYQPQILTLFTCVIRYGIINCSLFVSMANVMLLAIDRCFTIKFCYRYPIWATFYKMLTIAVSMWGVGAVLAVVAYYKGIKNFKICAFLKLASKESLIIPGAVFSLVLFVVIICYYFIIKEVKRHIREMTITTISTINPAPTNVVRKHGGTPVIKSNRIHPDDNIRRCGVSDSSTSVNQAGHQAGESVSASKTGSPKETIQSTSSKNKVVNNDEPWFTRCKTGDDLHVVTQERKKQSFRKYFTATKAVTIILAVFVSCNAPLTVLLLHLVVNPQLIDLSTIIVNTGLFLMVLNSLANPVIYAWKVKQLRLGFLLFFCENRCRERIQKERADNT